MATEGGLGPSKDTAVGEIVMITLTGSDPHGLQLGPDRDGNSAVIKAMERLPNGKFGSIQRHGGIHVGDVLFAINDTLLEHMSHKDALTMLNDRNLLRKQLRFISSAEYYARKKKHAAPSSAKVSSQQSFVSKVKRARVTDSAHGKYAEYEVACQWRIVGNDRLAKDRLFQWSVWKRFTEFDTLHKKITVSLGWLMDGVQFPRSYTMTLNKYTPEFIERRREELNTYWQSVIGIAKVAEFDKHHCSVELKQFLDVENAMLLNEQSGANSNALEKSEEEAASARPAARRLSVKPASSRRLSTKQDSIGNFTEETSGAVTTTTSRPRPQSQRVGGSNQSSPQPAKTTARPASSSSPPPAASTSSPPPAPVAAAVAAPSGPPMSKVMQDNLAKYSKMKSMLPEGAVRQRMGADGCTDADMDNFFGADTAAPPPAPAAAAPAAVKKATPASAPAAAAAPPSGGGGGKAPPGAPPKTAGRANLLADISRRRIE